jgi:hypothetical protein
MQPHLALIMIGVILGLPSAIFSIARPRRKGEPLDNQRKALLGLSLVGLLFLLAGAVIFWSGAR